MKPQNKSLIAYFHIFDHYLRHYVKYFCYLFFTIFYQFHYNSNDDYDDYHAYHMTIIIIIIAIFITSSIIWMEGDSKLDFGGVVVSATAFHFSGDQLEFY